MKTFKHGDKFSILSPDTTGIFEVMTPAGYAAEHERVYGRRPFIDDSNAVNQDAFLCNHSSVIDDGRGQVWPRDVQSFGDHIIVDGYEYVIVKAPNRRADLVPHSKCN